MDIDLLNQVSAIPWDAVEIGGVEEARLPSRLRANHFHVQCKTPFLVCARSHTSECGEEHFGLEIVTDPARVRHVLDGPFPPHHRPKMVSLESVVPEHLFPDFLAGKKRCVAAKKSVDGLKGAFDYKLTIEGPGLVVVVSADDAVPMAILITVDLNAASPS